MQSSTLERLLAFDREAAKGLSGFLAGVDEVGRGPLAGPVVAVSVILFKPENLTDLNDSKKISPARRQILYQEIIRNARIGIGVVDERQIDSINIYQATRLAMKQAVLDLGCTPDLLLIDGNATLDLAIPQKTVVRGDQKSAAIAAASIVAKVYRDAWMSYLDQLYPAYEFKSHKGYGTPLHLKKIRENGPSPVHRQSFSPVRDFSQKEIFHEV